MKEILNIKKMHYIFVQRINSTGNTVYLINGIFYINYETLHIFMTIKNAFKSILN